MTNEVSIKVTAKDETASTRSVIRNGFGVAGKDAGDAFGTELDKAAKAGGTKAGEDATKSTKEAVKKESSNGGGLSPMLLGLVAGAPAIGAAAGLALVGGLGVGLIGVGATVAARNDQVKASFQGLTADLSRTADSWSTVLAKPAAAAISQVQAEFDKLKPAIGTALGNVAPQFSVLTGTLTSFADRTMPGVLTASARLGPVFQGLRQDAGTLGASVGGAFDTVSQHSDSLGTSISSIERIVATTVNTAAPLVAKLSDEFAQHSGQIESAVSAVGSTITSLASTALPVLGTAIGGDLRLVTAFLGALGPAEGVLGAFGGAALSAYMNVRLLSNLSGPISSMAKGLKDAGTEGTAFGTITSKAGGALEKVGGALPAIGIGLTAVGMIMDLAAQHGEDLAKAGDDVAKGLEAGGSAATVARGHLTQWRQDAANAQKTLDGLTLSTTMSVAAAGRFGTSASLANSSQANANQTLSDAKTKIQEALDKYNQYTATLGVAAITADQLAGKTAIYADSAQNATSNTSQLKAAMDVLNSAASTADQRIQALQTTLAILGDNGLQKAQDYAAQFGAALDSFSGQVTSAKGAVFGLNGELDTNSAKGRAVLSILEQSQQSWAGQAQAMANAGQSTNQINTALQNNQNQLIGVLQAAGLTRGQIDSLIQTYGLVPRNISTRVDADTSPAVGAVQNLVRYINGTRAVVTVDTATGNTTSLNFGGGRRASAHGGVVGAAANGRTIGNDLMLVGEQGPELIRAAAGSTVIPNSGVSQEMRNAMGGGGQAAAIQVSFAGDMDSMFASMFMKFLRAGSIQIKQQYIQK